MFNSKKTVFHSAKENWEREGMPSHFPDLFPIVSVHEESGSVFDRDGSSIGCIMSLACADQENMKRLGAAMQEWAKTTNLINSNNSCTMNVCRKTFVAETDVSKEISIQAVISVVVGIANMNLAEDAVELFSRKKAEGKLNKKFSLLVGVQNEFLKICKKHNLGVSVLKGADTLEACRSFWYLDEPPPPKKRKGTPASKRTNRKAAAMPLNFIAADKTLIFDRSYWKEDNYLNIMYQFNDSAGKYKNAEGLFEYFFSAGNILEPSVAHITFSVGGPLCFDRRLKSAVKKKKNKKKMAKVAEGGKDAAVKPKEERLIRFNCFVLMGHPWSYKYIRANWGTLFESYVLKTLINHDKMSLFQSFHKDSIWSVVDIIWQENYINLIPGVTRLDSESSCNFADLLERTIEVGK